MQVRIEESWQQVLGDQFESDYFKTLAEFVRAEYRTHTVYPPGRLIFNALDLSPFEEVRVVIIGQDPYHNPGQAHGLCFSVCDGVDFPPSLVNIFKEIRSDLGIETYKSGNLERWARQGVLLLNAILTVRQNEPGSHQNKGWERFTEAVINQLSDKKAGLVFMLWGKHAQDKGKRIDRSKHLVLESVHPSPLSASRGFFGNHHFSRCNEYLALNGRQPIDWR
ncbi:MAG: uracil-DNA glycosylase [Bacteroidales bacterium]|jgi:uracil-DNA glycosylase|nr:uracil-DNA glycosylase [Bacteroidales bacterium]